MAESAVSYLVQRLATLAKDEIIFLANVGEEIKSIKDEFQSIKILLRNADAKADTDDGVKDWVAQIRGVAYEIEDALDEYFLSRHHSHGTFDGCIEFIDDIFKTIRDFFISLMAHHELGNQITNIKVKIQDICRREERYRLSKLDGASSSTTTATSTHDPRVDALFLEEAQLVGTDRPKEILIEYIFEANVKLSTVSVFGEGGLGKTTVVKKVFDSPQVRGRFPYRAWLTVSQTPDVKTLLTTLLKHLFPGIPAEDSTINLKQQLNNNLRGKSYIVVLDDIWTVDAWKELRHALPDDNETGSRILVTTRKQILVTTRKQDVANTCIQGCGHTYQLERLNSEHSWKLLYMKACNSRVDDMSSYPEDLLKAKSENFLKKCFGLPLAIVAMGGLLSTKRLTEWDQVYQTLGSFPLKDLSMVISLSFNDLPYYLKSCFLYMCMFPEDYVIKCSRLLRLWVAVGFVETKQDIDVSMGEIAKSFLEELIQRSLIQVYDMDECKRVVTCKIHDVMRDFIVGKARDQNFAQVIARKQDEQQFLTGEDSTRMLQQPRHLSICTSEGGGDVENNILFGNNNRLVVHSRSLLVFSLTYTFSTTNMFLSSRLLKVLDLENADIEEFPKVVLNLFHLRYLSLRRNKRIDSLPNTMGKLVNLETLDIKDTRITKLPVTILKLKQLRNLIMRRWHFIDGVDLPVGIGCLITLENLGVVRANEFVVEELSMLTRLRKLSISELDDGKQLFASIHRMKYLRSLKVSGEFEDTQSPMLPPPSLRRLCVTGILNELPDWFSLLQNLEKLTLMNTKLTNDPFRVLQALPNLVILRLAFEAFVGEELCIGKHGFPRLKKLILFNSPNLNDMEVEQGAMPVIQTIGFQGCGSLVNIPYGITHLLTLQTILYNHYMPDAFVEQLMDHQNQLRQKGILLQVEQSSVLV